MKRYTLLTVICLMALQPLALQAQRRDTTYKDNTSYKEELGYFRKAHSDLGDPRFMFTDDGGNFSFGIGGTFSTIAYTDFAGALGIIDFVPYKIPIPSDYSPNYGITIKGSELHVKARGYVGTNKIVAYMKLNSKLDGTNYMVKIPHAYVSFNGFTMGRTYSFFMDLEAGPMTIDLQGPNSQVNAVHPLVGYTHYFGDHWMVGAAIEESFNAFSGSFGKYYLKNSYRTIPDIAMRVKYRGDQGHIQLAALLLDNAYWSDTLGFVRDADGIVRNAWGGGLSVSGNYNPFAHVGFSAQFAGGKGIAEYLQDLEGNDVKMCGDTALYNGYPKLYNRWCMGGYFSVNVSWCDFLKSAFIYGITYAPRVPDGTLAVGDGNYRMSTYGAANLFWLISPYARIGAEYVYGYRENYYNPQSPDQPLNGHANRLNLTFIYQF